MGIICGGESVQDCAVFAILLQLEVSEIEYLDEIGRDGHADLHVSFGGSDAGALTFDDAAVMTAGLAFYPAIHWLE